MNFLRAFDLSFYTWWNENWEWKSCWERKNFPSYFVNKKFSLVLLVVLVAMDKVMVATHMAVVNFALWLNFECCWCLMVKN
jgi:hypothetical protein